MRPYILFIIFLIGTCALTAQSNYTEAIQQGDAALRRGAYKTAIDKYFAAEAFDPNKKEVVRGKVKEVFDKIEALRREAEAARKQADQKTREAIAEKERADQKTDEAIEEKQRADDALKQVQTEEQKTKDALKLAEASLAEVRLKNISIFGSFSELGIELIYKLDHAEALEKLKVAAEIDVDIELKKQQLEEPISELLFFFAESGRRLELARTAAGLLMKLEPPADLAQALQQCALEGWQTRVQFTSLLEKLPLLSKLQARYYPEMAPVPLGDEGVFEMGSSPSEWNHQLDETLHKVKLSPYQMAATPVTFYQFALFSEAIDRLLASRTPYWGRYGDHPVVSVTWYEALEYANWLNAQQGLPPVYTIQKEKNSDPDNQVELDNLKWKVAWNPASKGFRLPTEAEWELAARGGVGAPRTLFAGSDTLDDVGWYLENSGDKPLPGECDLTKNYDNNCRTHTVKEKRHNGIGLYDMSGNVYEWCWDWYDTGYYVKCRKKGVTANPAGAKSSVYGRVMRGGSWDGCAVNCRLASRSGFLPDTRDDGVGFRLVFVP
jgi:sulfatase modifying factor 1